jgi:histidyl-tRNA synthetase
MKIQRCKGMRDLSPREMKIFHYIQGIYRDNFLKWGYQEVRTPTIEYLHLFTSAGTLTPGMLGKVYSFLDWDGWSGERVVLRPEGTIPVARMYVDKMQGFARLFYTANVFRFEQTGENREVWQCGAEIIGAGSAIADAELIALSLDILKKLGINAEIRLSHAGLINALLTRLGLSQEEHHKIFDKILDGDTGVLAQITKESPELGNSLLPLLSLKGQTPGFLRNQQALLCRDIPAIKAPLEDFLKTVAILDNLGIGYQINIASGSGFEYYTGIIFQLYAGKQKVGGGGRYDALVSSMGGNDTPASGFALYLDRLMNQVRLEDSIETDNERVLIKASTNFVKEAFNMADSLRQAGFIAEIDLDGQKADWVIEVKGKAPLFTLINKARSIKKEFPNIRDTVKFMEGQVGN